MKRRKYIDGISIQEFVSYYLGTEHDCYNLKHQGLKSFNNPYVIGVSNDFALKNPDYVMRQELIVVIDDYGKPGTYINPANIHKLIEIETCKEKIKFLESIKCYNFKEIATVYQMWMKLVTDIKFLEGLYGSTYELLYLTNKTKVLKAISDFAKEEAKRTLIFTLDKTTTENEESCFSYDEFDETTNDESEEQLIYYAEDDIKVTEKVNRQKTLKYKIK